MLHRGRRFFALSLVIGCLLIELPHAHALGGDDSSSYDSWGGGDFVVCEALCAVVLVGLFVVPPLTFATAQVVYGVEGEWLPVGWAVPELIFGVLHATVFTAAALESDDSSILVPLAMLHGWFVVHAVLSLVLNGPAAQARARDRARAQTSVAVLPTSDGAVAVVSGLF